MASKHLLLLYYTTLLAYCSCEPLSYGAAFLGSIIVGASVASYNYVHCKFNECCEAPWINFKEDTLRDSLEKNLYGQHLVESIVIKSLRGFLKKKNPQKPLVMSFHGFTGTGKNFVSSMIAKSLYEKGMNSSYVHQYIANNDFPHESKVQVYQERLRRDIIKYTKECGRSLFIFDEVDKMPTGILNTLKPFMDYHEHINNVVFRRNIYIFLSNAGAQSIVNKALEFWARGQEREDITMKEIEPLISKGAYNEIGGFKFSELLSSQLVDTFVPFLPLEKKHVRMCIEAEFRSRNMAINKTLINEIAEELVYFPRESELFSESGCKRIIQKIDTFLDD